MFEHTPVPVSDFRGRFERGYDEAVPLGYFSDEGNLVFTREGVESRRGFSAVVGLNPSAVTRVHEYRRIGEASRYIYCTSSGEFYDSLFPGTPILSLAGVSDFAMVVMFNRAYISPHNRVTGITSQKLYVYDGAGTARVAAGSAPSGYTLQATEGASTGNASIEKGVHLFAIAFETSSGHITKPGLEGTAVAKLTASGGKDVNLSSIPTGPSGTVARHILCTKILPNYADGTASYQEWYYLPNGRIADNTTTSFQFSFFDIALQDSADVLLNQLAEIPAGVFLCDYEGRLCVGGEAQNPSTIRVSDPGMPESFSALDGFVNVSPGDAGGGVTNGVAHRGTLYASKSQRFYATNSGAGSPSAWPVISVDSGIGTECFGISSVLDSRGHSRDQFLVAARSGLYQYLGAFNERELTWNIKGTWDRINKNYFNKIQVVVDPQREWIAVAIPLDANTENSHILVGDYSEALEPTGVKWSLWSIPKKPTSLIIKVNDTTKASTIVFASSENGIFEYDDAARVDIAATKIEAFLESNLMEHPQNMGGINHFAGVRMRIRGSGTAQVRLTGYDGALTEAYPSIALASAPGAESLVRTDFLCEKASVKLTLNAAGNWFILSRIITFVKPQWMERPE